MRTITAPGKFEGEPWFVPELWGKALDGGANYDIYNSKVGWAAVFELTNKEKKEYKIDKPYIMLSEDRQGFVKCFCLTQKELNDSF